MPRKSYTKEKILEKLDFVMSMYNQGQTIDDACKAAEIGKGTYYRWRDKYCRIKTEDNGSTKQTDKPLKM